MRLEQAIDFDKYHEHIGMLMSIVGDPAENFKSLALFGLALLASAMLAASLGVAIVVEHMGRLRRIVLSICLLAMCGLVLLVHEWLWTTPQLVCD